MIYLIKKVELLDIGFVIISGNLISNLILVIMRFFGCVILIDSVMFLILKKDNRYICIYIYIYIYI